MGGIKILKPVYQRKDGEELEEKLRLVPEALNQGQAIQPKLSRILSI